MTPTQSKLGDYVLPVRSVNPSALLGDSDFTYVDISSVDRELRAITSPQLIPASQAPSRARQETAENDVIVSTVRPNLNTVAVVTDEYAGAIASTGFCVLRAVPGKLDARYLFHWISSEATVKQLVGLATGATYPAVSDKTIKSLPLAPPSLFEQQRIAAILDKADSLRRKRQEAIRLADELLKAVFFDMFGDLTVNPYAWPELPLGELIEDGPRNGLYCPSEMYGSGVPILRIDGFYNGKIVNDYPFKRVQIDESTKARFSLMDDSVVLNRVNSREFVGKAAHVFNLEEPTVFESNMMNFSVDRNRIDPNFLVEQLQSAFIRDQIARARKDAVNQSSINQEDVKGLHILVPPISEQERFRKIADGQMQLQSRLEQSKKALVKAQASLSFALLGEYSSR